MTCLVMLPGLDGTGELFRRFRDVAEFDCEVVAYDRQRCAGYPALVSLVRERLPRGRPYWLLGESFSGPVAVSLAAENPDGLRGLVLCNSFVMPPASRLLRRLPWRALFQVRPPRPVLRRYLVGDEAADELCDEVVAAIRSVDAAVLADRIRQVLRVDVRAELGGVRVPVVDLRSRQDRLVLSGSAAAVRGAHPAVERLSRDGPHLLLQACPAVSVAALAGYLA